MQRRIYEDRTNLVLKDLKDQPIEKYVAIIEGLGEKAAVAFDKIVINGESVLLVGSPSSLAKTQGDVVAAFGIRSNWLVVARDKFVEMTGKEWDTFKLADAKNRAEIHKGLFGESQVVTVATFPDGQQAMLPVTEEQAAAFKLKEAEKVEKVEEEKKGVPTGGYL